MPQSPLGRLAEPVGEAADAVKINQEKNGLQSDHSLMILCRDGEAT
jgi:hypothetical protein